MPRLPPPVERVGPMAALAVVEDAGDAGVAPVDPAPMANLVVQMPNVSLHHIVETRCRSKSGEDPSVAIWSACYLIGRFSDNLHGAGIITFDLDAGQRALAEADNVGGGQTKVIVVPEVAVCFVMIHRGCHDEEWEARHLAAIVSG